MNLNDPKIVVAIENAVIEQVEASGITGELHRLDGEKIIDVILEQLEGFVLVPKKPSQKSISAMKVSRCQFSTYAAESMYEAIIKAQEQGHDS